MYDRMIFPSQELSKHRIKRTYCIIFALNLNKMTESSLEDLNMVMHILSYVGKNQYRFFAAVNHNFHNAYLQLYPNNKRTYCYKLQVCTTGRVKFDCTKHSLFGDDMNQYYLCESAARRGNLEALQNLHSLRCRWDVRVCEAAAKNGHLHILQWALVNGTKQNGGWIWEWNEWVCAYAAEIGHLHILEWAHENGCPKNDLICAWAALGGHLGTITGLSMGCTYMYQRRFTRSFAYYPMGSSQWLFMVLLKLRKCYTRWKTSNVTVGKGGLVCSKSQHTSKMK
jgi:hypothetical protein